jgi:hypothetical protein
VRTPACFVLAHGRALRMYSETGGASKGLLPLDERTTILSNLLDACHAQGLDPVLTVGPDDDRLSAFAAGRRMVHTEPSGYIVDVARLSAGAGDVIVLDCDTVADPMAIGAALQVLLTSASPCTLALSALPLSDDPRSIRPLVRDGCLAGLSSESHVPRTTGIYRFQGEALEDIRRFVHHGRGTFHDYIETAALMLQPMAVHVMSIAFNVNWPADYYAARKWWNESQRASWQVKAIPVPA